MCERATMSVITSSSSRNRGRATPPFYDICIVGSGPAGSTVASLLAGSGSRICVVECGDREQSAFADRLKDLDCSGIHIKEYSRERILGGTSTTWAGLSSPLDPVDFETRPWLPLSGWPITREELVPDYREASRRFGFPPWEHFLNDHWMWSGKDPGSVPDWRRLEKKVFLAADPAQHFARDFGDIYHGEAVDLYLGAPVTRIVGDPATGMATGVEISQDGGGRLLLKAARIVLACGGIENSRLLLNSTFACRSGLGNDRDQVGRCFMNHPKDNHGIIRLTRPQARLPGYFGFLSLAEGCAGYVGLRLNDQSQREQRLLNAYVRFEPIFNWTDDPGVAALISYLKRSRWLMRMFKRSKRGELVELRSYAETGDDSDMMNGRKRTRDHLAMLGDVAAHPLSVLRYLRSRLRDRAPEQVTAIRLRNFMEMAPHPDNRITLSERIDALGQRLPHVSHESGLLDRRSMAAIHEALHRELAETGWGRLDSQLAEETEPWPINTDASHHMGGTRMGQDPATSVANRDARLHFCPNVYLAGSSLFPTSGCANPTWTIVALAIRLARHLTRQLATNPVAAGESD
jgi:choline dehydrogenase-like flavoprotein